MGAYAARIAQENSKISTLTQQLTKCKADTAAKDAEEKRLYDQLVAKRKSLEKQVAQCGTGLTTLSNGIDILKRDLRL